MFFFDLTLLGVYYFMNPIYSLLNKSEDSFKAEDHALLIIWSAHSANVVQIVSLFIKKSFYLKATAISLVLILLLLGYYIYYVKNRIKKILNKKINLPKSVLIFIVTILYVFFSIYFYFRD